MFVNKRENSLPVKVWMSEQEFYEDNEMQKQIFDLAGHPFVYHHVALTPDGHAGFGMPIGGVVPFEGAICPNGVGVDIACGMLAYPLKFKSSLFDIDSESKKKIIHQVKRDVPMGMNRRKDTTEYRKEAEEIVSQFFEVED